MKKSLYEIELGEVIVIEDSSLFITAMRVPSGWIFRSVDKSSYLGTSTFVPYDNSFAAPNLDKKFPVFLKTKGE